MTKAIVNLINSIQDRWFFNNIQKEKISIVSDLEIAAWENLKGSNSKICFFFSKILKESE